MAESPDSDFVSWTSLTSRFTAVKPKPATSLVDLMLYASGWRYAQSPRCGVPLPTRMGVAMALGGNLVPVTYLREMMIRQGDGFEGEG
jgi:hypothetical protein